MAISLSLGFCAHKFDGGSVSANLWTGELWRDCCEEDFGDFGDVNNWDLLVRISLLTMHILFGLVLAMDLSLLEEGDPFLVIEEEEEKQSLMA